MELAVAGSSEVALRNEEVNRRRMQGRKGDAGGPLKVTDPAALQRLMAEMKLKAEQQKELERQREEERAKREGAAYKPPEERAKEAKEAKEEFQASNEARTLDGSKLDPRRDYYAALGLDRAASSAQVRKAYKRLALLYHPDKHKAEGEEQRAAVASRFLEVTAAFDVLADEEQRRLYDKVRDHMEANPGKGLPVLTPEEAAMVRAGAGELSRLRRQGPKLGKHPPLRRDVAISLAKLNAGCTKAVTVERRRVDYSGQAFLSSKTFHLVVRRGSREGDTLLFEEEGEETVDTNPGDLVITLRAKPHPTLRRRGDKDVETFAAAVPHGDALYAAEVETILGERRLVLVRALRAALAGGGVGGVWCASLPGQGLYDASEPWEKAAGDMVVRLRYPPVLLGERLVTCCVRPGAVYLLGSGDEVVPAAMAGGAVAAVLCHHAEARHMAMDHRGPPPTLRAVCLSVACCGRQQGSGAGGTGEAAAAVLRVLRARVPGLRATTASFCAAGDAPAGLVDDAAWCALHDADALVLDLALRDGCRRGTCLALARARLEDAGVMHLLWQLASRGCPIVAAGAAGALLAAPHDQLGLDAAAAPPVLPWYLLRAGGGDGGGAEGWSDLYEAVAAAPEGAVGVGVMASSCCAVDAGTGTAELLVAPRREALIQAACWAAEHSADAAGLQDASDDFGFCLACAR